MEPIESQQKTVQKTAWSMAVPMVCIWNMGVAVRDRLMLVPMAVGACRHRLMNMVMVMVPIVMPVSMFMF